MDWKDVFTYLFIVQSVQVKILHSVHTPSLSAEVQEPSFCVLYSQVCCFQLISYLPLWDKGSKAVISHNVGSWERVCIDTISISLPLQFSDAVY